MQNDWLDDILNDADVKTEPEWVKPEEPLKTGRPVHAHQWGGTEREVDPFLAETLSEEERPVSVTDDMTPEEDAELRKHEESLNGNSGKGRKVEAPPMPAHPPSVHQHTHDEATEEEPADEVNEENPKALKKATSAFKSTIVKAKPVVAKAKNTVDPKSSAKWSLLWSAGAGAVVGPDAFVALYDRIILLAGESASGMPRGAELLAGSEPHDFNFFHGLVMWVRDCMGAAWEAGVTERVLIAAALGIVPQLIASIPWKWASWVAGLSAAGYIAFGWYPQWWEVYMTGLAATSYYGWMMAKRFSEVPEDEKKAWHDVIAFLCRIPMASAVAGVITYSPGAIF